MVSINRVRVKVGFSLELGLGLGLGLGLETCSKEIGPSLEKKQLLVWFSLIPRPHCRQKYVPNRTQTGEYPSQA